MSGVIGGQQMNKIKEFFCVLEIQLKNDFYVSCFQFPNLNRTTDLSTEV